MKKMRLVFALALAGLTALTAQASPMDNEEAASIADVAPPVMEFVDPEVFIQPEINVIFAVGSGFNSCPFHPDIIYACTTMVSFDSNEIFLEADPASAAVPEPATLPLLGLGLVAIAAMRRNRQK